MGQTEESIEHLLRGLDPADAPEVREFARRTAQEQMIYLFIEVRKMQRQRDPRNLIASMGPLGALVAYVMFDQRWWTHLVR